MRGTLAKELNCKFVFIATNWFTKVQNHPKLITFFLTNCKEREQQE